MQTEDEFLRTGSVGFDFRQNMPEFCSFCAPNKGYIVIKKKLENGLEVEQAQKCPACNH